MGEQNKEWNMILIREKLEKLSSRIDRLESEATVSFRFERETRPFSHSYHCEYLDKINSQLTSKVVELEKDITLLAVERDRYAKVQSQDAEKLFVLKTENERLRECIEWLKNDGTNPDRYRAMQDDIARLRLEVSSKNVSIIELNRKNDRFRDDLVRVNREHLSTVSENLALHRQISELKNINWEAELDKLWVRIKSKSKVKL